MLIKLIQTFIQAAGVGVEPTYIAPGATVLPLDDPANLYSQISSDGDGAGNYSQANSSG